MLISLIDFRKEIKSKYGLVLKEEIHAQAFLQYQKHSVRKIRKDHLLLIYKKLLQFQSSLSTNINIINVVVQKEGKDSSYDVFDMAWRVLFQRFYNTIEHQNFRGPKNNSDKGIVVNDATNKEKLRQLIRKLRKYNPVPHHPEYPVNEGHRQIPLDLILEDPNHRDSLHSYFIQCCDVNAYALLQKLKANKYIKKKGGRNWFDLLDPALCKVANKGNPQGIVYL